MINKRKRLRLIVVMIGFFLLSLIVIVAKPEVGSAVSVKPILPKNQHNSEATYYDLRMKPSQEQELNLELANTSDTEQKVTFQINDATTNDSGDIDYSDRSKSISRDKSLKISLKDIATIESELIIPAKKTITTRVYLKMPENKFDGMILGGIKVVSSEKNNKLSDSDDKRQDKKTYIVAVKLTETDTPIVAKLNLLTILSSRESNKTVIKATIQNDQAVNLEDIEFVAKVYKKDSDQLFSQSKVTGYRMAPNSSFVFKLDEENKKFSAGKYQIELTAKSKATNQEWQWKKELEIAKSDNRKDRTAKDVTDKEKIMLYTIICVITFVLLLLLLLILLILRKRKEKRYEEALYHRKKKRDRNNKNIQRNRKSKSKNVERNKKKKPADYSRSKR
ncbi:hypothetical protein A5821_002317 [Enterococcus sp. 7F3_DIV0205]|uniref:DUF3324 domain-containing protein n=1 Tax=Candidatus Enterococcus palustris TaxID=1834189 RepID=A0AAQ3Y7V9_9ENTE|nr:DUF916 and DUF3324 domain-containing protein [Enterococcus sp. 7F3_DIV0205]OTN82747.1 hypothetical protein A5821_002670 [Enterococcus sp. 7F3_DIV0205]